MVTGHEVARLRSARGWFSTVKFSADGKRLFAGDSNGTVKVWQVNAAGKWVGAKTLVAAPQPGSCVMPSPLFPFFVTQWEFPPIYRLAVSPDRTQLAACFRHVPATAGPAIFVWNLADGSPAPAFSAANALSAGASMLRGVAFSPRGDLMAAGFEGANSRGVLVWDVATRKVKQALRPDLGAVYHVCFSADRRNLACGCYEGVELFDTEGKIEVRDATGGQVTTTFGKKELIHGQSIHTALSPDATWLAVGGDKSVTVWDMNKRELVLALPEERGTIWSLAWSANRDLLAVGSSTGDLVIWNLPRIKGELSRIGLGW